MLCKLGLSSTNPTDFTSVISEVTGAMGGW